MILGVGMRTVMLEFWVDLGEELGEVCWVLEALDQVEWKRRKRSVQRRKKERNWVALRALGVLSLDNERKSR